MALLRNYKVHKVHKLQHLHLHSCCYALDETVAKLVRKVLVQQRMLMSNVVTATYVDEQCGCIGRCHAMHCIIRIYIYNLIIFIIL